ncbi:Nucleolar protein,Nop52 containing protein [Histomonas meleagridis]|uniref:Nucleolar protein,Nop52 containing protein n=1 Tax=Histomonas meleagridis TaxID=135588 RepID=UPI00355A1989|nr:Nucleolar protein,Nop52 containing protein [Histomonas meleagridis]KAH0801293.1 Nucleolar protein,Nop52 containing protein [Histomonas meleagridis]
MATICGNPFPYGPKIASDEQDEREEALAEIIEWLKKQTQFDEEDGQKLWYVLINGLWKTDMVLVQHSFCKKISAILFKIPQQFVKTFMSTFFSGMAKQWGQLDKWRIEKFLVLVRYFLNTIIEWCQKNNEIEFLLQLFNEVLSLETGTGLQLQFIDVITEPLTKLIKENTKKNSKLAKPFFEVFSSATTKTGLVLRIHEKLVEPLINSDGEFFFGNDVEASLNFFRYFINILNKSLKTPAEVVQQVLQLRYDVAAQVRLEIKTILEVQSQLGKPAEKITTNE